MGNIIKVFQNIEKLVFLGNFVITKLFQARKIPRKEKNRLKGEKIHTHYFGREFERVSNVECGAESRTAE